MTSLDQIQPPLHSSSQLTSTTPQNKRNTPRHLATSPTTTQYRLRSHSPLPMIIKSGEDITLATLEDAMRYIEELENKYKVTQNELLQSLETNEELFAEISTLYDKLKYNQGKFNMSYKELESNIELTDTELNDLADKVLELSSEYSHLQTLHNRVKSELGLKSKDYDELQRAYDELLQRSQISQSSDITDNTALVQQNVSMKGQIEVLQSESAQLKAEIAKQAQELVTSANSSSIDAFHDEDEPSDPVLLRHHLNKMTAENHKQRQLIKQHEITISKLTAQLAQSQTDQTIAASPTRSVEACNSKLIALEEDNCELRADKMMLNNDVLSLQTKLKHALDKHEQQAVVIIDLNKQSNDLNQQKHELRTHLNTVLSQLDKATDELVKSKNNEKYDQPQPSSKPIENESEITALQVQLRSQSQRIISLEEDHLATQRALKSREEELRGEYEHVLKKYENLKEMYYELESALQSKSNQLKNAKLDLGEKDKMIESLKMNSPKPTNTNLDEIDEDSQFHPPSDDIFSKNQQLKQLYQVIEHLEDTITKLTTTNEANQAQIVKLLAYEEELLNSNAELQQKVNQLIKLETGLLKSQTVLSDGVELSSGEYSKLCSKHQTLLEEYNQLKIHAHDLQVSLDEATTALKKGSKQSTIVNFSDFTKSQPTPAQSPSCTEHLQQIAQLEDEIRYLNEVLGIKDEQLNIYHEDIDHLTTWAEGLYQQLAEQCIPKPQDLEVFNKDGECLNQVLINHVDVTTNASSRLEELYDDGTNNTSQLSAATNSSTSSSQLALQKSSHQLRRALAVKEAIEQTLHAHTTQQLDKTSNPPNQSFPSPFLSSNSTTTTLQQNNSANLTNQYQPQQQPIQTQHPRQRYNQNPNINAKPTSNVHQQFQQQQPLQRQHPIQQQQPMSMTNLKSAHRTQPDESHTILPTLTSPGKFKLHNAYQPSSSANPLNQLPKRDPSTSNVIHNLIPKDAILSPKKVSNSNRMNSSSTEYELPNLDSSSVQSFSSNAPTYPVRDITNPQQQLNMNEYQYQWSVPNNNSTTSSTSRSSSHNTTPSTPSALAQTPRKRDSVRIERKPATPFRSTIFTQTERSVTYQSELNQMLRLELENQAKQQQDREVITYTIDPVAFAKKYTQNNTMKLNNPPKFPGQTTIYQSTVDIPIESPYQLGRGLSAHQFDTNQSGPVLNIIGEYAQHHHTPNHNHIPHNHNQSRIVSPAHQTSHNIDPRSNELAHPPYYTPQQHDYSGYPTNLPNRQHNRSADQTLLSTTPTPTHHPGLNNSYQQHANRASLQQQSTHRDQPAYNPSLPQLPQPNTNNNDLDLPKPAFMMYMTPKR